MGSEDWIKRIFDEKKAQNNAANFEVAVESERRKKFEAQADDFRNQLAAMCSKAVDDYNGHVLSNAQRIQYTVPTQLVFEASKSLRHRTTDLWVSILRHRDGPY